MIVPKYMSNKNIVLRTNYRYHFPLGIAYIMAVMKKAGYCVDCINLNHLEGSIENIINKRLDFKKYDFVCTGGNALLYSVIEKIINNVKKHPTKPKFILGGPIITTEPELIFNALSPDYGVIGEGEETILELLKIIKSGKNLSKVKGIIYRNKSGDIIQTPRRPVLADLEKIPYPDFEGVGFMKQLDNMHCNDFYYSFAFDNPRVYTIMGSRGCPFQCTFCYHEDKYRKRSIKDIMKELRTNVIKYRINIINLLDEQLSLTKERIYSFCDQIEKLQKEIPWKLRWTCQLSVISVDSNLLKRMKETGCTIVSYGFESFSQPVLNNMKKPITPNQIEQAFNSTLKNKIGIQAFFIFGDPAETKETANETITWWKKNSLGQIGAGFIQPYPGSEIYKYCLRKGIIKNKLDYIKNEISKEHWYNMTEKMSDKDIKKLKNEILKATSKYTKYVLPNSKKKCGEGSYDFKVCCPFCQNVGWYRNCFINGRFTYGFQVICRYCGKRFFLVSQIQKIAYKYYNWTRVLRDVYLRIRESIKKRKI